MGEFFREATNEEKKEWKPVVDERKQTPKEKFLDMVAEKSKETTINRTPFCQRCARLDFEDEWGRKIKFLEETQGYAKVEKMKVDFPNLDTYTDKWFTLLNETDAMEPVHHSDGKRITRQIKIGVHRNYQCKLRKCKVSIFISNEELEKEKK